MSPLDKAIRLYRINATIGFVLAVLVIGAGLSTLHPLGIILGLVASSVAAVPGFVAVMVSRGLRAGNADPVLRGLVSLRKLYGLVIVGIVGFAGVTVRLLLDEFDIYTLIGGLILVGLLSGLAALLRHSFRAVNHPQVQEHLGLLPRQETQPS
jgi:hypothetical protein